jgi:predicted nucleotidyltransferase
LYSSKKPTPQFSGGFFPFGSQDLTIYKEVRDLGRRSGAGGPVGLESSLRIKRMIPVVQNSREAVERLCRRFRVRRLELFGSAVGEQFNPETSDLDFLVDFEELEPEEYADTYFGLLEGLRELFKRNVDLVMVSAVKNPYFLESIERSRTLLYAA